MNLETQFETEPEGPESPGLALWQKIALAFALVSTLAGLALGGFGSEPAGVSAASPQSSPSQGAEAPGLKVDSFAAQGTDPAAPAEEPEASGVWAPLLAKGGLSFFLAFCVGYAMRAALKILFLSVGLATLAVFGLQDAGILSEVQWDRLSEFWEVGVAAAREQMDGLQAFVSGKLPSAASGTLGLFTGFRRTS